MRTIPREVRNFQKIKSNFILTEKQKAIALGTLLGDGSLNKRGNDYRLHIKHSKNQLFFVEYKHSVFSSIVTMPINIFSQKVKDKFYEFAEFVTLTHPEFTKLHQLFYRNGKKSITTELCSQITNPLSIAIWFMDDGSCDNSGVIFNTQCFELSEIKMLQNLFATKFNLQTTYRRNKKGWVIYVPKNSLPILQNLIGKYILPEFFYKLVPYNEKSNPVETTCRTPTISGVMI